MASERRFFWAKSPLPFLQQILTQTFKFFTQCQLSSRGANMNLQNRGGSGGGGGEGGEAQKKKNNTHTHKHAPDAHVSARGRSVRKGGLRSQTRLDVIWQTH